MTLRLALAALLLALVPLRARAAEPPLQPGPPPAERRQPSTLSKEDEAMLKELALLERVELLRNLELFEQKDADPRAAETTPRPRPP